MSIAATAAGGRIWTPTGCPWHAMGKTQVVTESLRDQESVFLNCISDNIASTIPQRLRERVGTVVPSPGSAASCAPVVVRMWRKVVRMWRKVVRMWRKQHRLFGVRELVGPVPGLEKMPTKARGMEAALLQECLDDVAIYVPGMGDMPA